MQVCHHCDNKGCVRPDHFFLGTNADNARDAMHKQLTTWGERNAHAKLTDADVLVIRAISTSGVGKPEIQDRFGISRSHLNGLLRRAYWRNLPAA